MRRIVCELFWLFMYYEGLATVNNYYSIVQTKRLALQRCQFSGTKSINWQIRCADLFHLRAYFQINQN